MVGQRREVLGQPPGLVAEQPGGGAGEQVVGLEQVDLAGTVGGQHHQACRLGRADGGDRVRLDGHGQVEGAADAGAQRLGVVEVDRAAGQDDRVGTGGVGTAHDGAGVAGVTDVGADGDQPRVLGDGPVELDVDEAAHGHDAGRTDRVAERGQRAVVDQGAAYAGGQVGHEPERVRAHQDLLDAPRDEGPLDGLRAVSEEEPPLRTLGAAAQPTQLLDARVARGQRGLARLDHRRDQAETLGALTSSGRAALAVSTSALNAAMSLTARSARILRSTSTPARFRPWMNRL